METLPESALSSIVGTVACCECGLGIAPNPLNMCAGCVRSRIDITEGIARTNVVYACKFCLRYFVPPTAWQPAQPESKELLAICLKKIKPALAKVRLTDASFVWSEAHSKRIRVKVTVQKEVFQGAVIQQSFIIVFTVQSQTCEDCHRAEADHFWRACVQVRQRCDFKKTLFYLEQLIIKHNAHVLTTGIKPVSTGIDFYYPKLQDARKLVDFLVNLLPVKYHYAQELVSHDTKNNTFDYKHTFCVEVVPICRDNVICVPRPLAQQMGNMSQILVCLRVSNVVTLIDPSNLQMCDVTAMAYWKDPFDSLCQPKQLTEFYVEEVEDVNEVKRGPGHAFVSKKHSLADVWLVRSNEVGKSDAQRLFARTHLGRLIAPGDCVLGFDLRNSNVNSPTLDAMRAENVPDVVVVKKVYDRAARQRKRLWKLRRLDLGLPDTASQEDQFAGFIEDLEEDPTLREKVNIYKDHEKMERIRKGLLPMVQNDEGDLPPEAPTLAEMLDNLELDGGEDEEDGAAGRQHTEEMDQD